MQGKRGEWIMKQADGKERKEDEYILSCLLPPFHLEAEDHCRLEV